MLQPEPVGSVTAASVEVGVHRRVLEAMVTPAEAKDGLLAGGISHAGATAALGVAWEETAAGGADGLWREGGEEQKIEEERIWAFRDEKTRTLTNHASDADFCYLDYRPHQHGAQKSNARPGLVPFHGAPVAACNRSVSALSLGGRCGLDSNSDSPL